MHFRAIRLPLVARGLCWRRPSAAVGVRRVSAPALAADARAARRPGGAARARARRSSSCSCSARSRCCRRPASRDAVVPVLVDVSRSMRLADADGQTRARARDRAAEERARAARCRRASRPSSTRVGDGARAGRRSTASPPTRGAPISRARWPPCASAIAASASPASSCSRTAAIRGRVGQVGRVGGQVAGRRRGRRAAGVRGRHRLARRSARSRSARHRRPAIRGSITRRSICTCRAVSTGFGRTPFTLRVLGNGQLLDTRRIVPPADGSPIDEVFTVSPDPLERRPSTPPRSRATSRSRSSRTTRAACSSARPAASAGCSSSKARPGSSTAS